MSWLWRNDSSPASFEKALSRLSSQITTSNVSLDKSRSRSRRIKALWTLYTTLAYLISVLILLLVLGPSELSLPHYAGLLGAPVLIFGVRKAISAIFGWSIARQQSQVDRLTKQRDEKILELKKATRFDSTQELLSKYGGEKPKPQQQKQKDEKPKENVQRTGLPPPPTANIPGRVVKQQQPQIQQREVQPQQEPHVQKIQQNMIEPPGFAPNAFPEPSSAPHWYDRILDVMLGEDETLAKNRIALVCMNPECRLVNGQAPPGTKSLEEVGRWRCQGCGSWNGVQKVSEVSKALEEEQVVVEADSPEEEQEVAVDVNEDEVDEAEEPTAIEKKEKATRRVTRQMARDDD